MLYPNLKDVRKVVLRGKFITLNGCIRLNKSKWAIYTTQETKNGKSKTKDRRKEKIKMELDEIEIINNRNDSNHLSNHSYFSSAD